MLTERQIEVLDRFCDGKTDAEIATDLVVEESTVRQHLRSICVAFGLTDPPNCQHRDELKQLCCEHSYHSNPRDESGLVVFTVNGSINPAAVKKLKSILRVLQTISDDLTIDIEDIELGSIRLILNGSPEGLERLEALFQAGELSEIEGLSVEDVQFVTTQTFENREDRQATGRKQLALTIAGHVETEDLAKLKAAVGVPALFKPTRNATVRELAAFIAAAQHRSGGGKGTDVLHKLVVRTCQYPPRSRERQRGLTQLVGVIERSGKLWKENVPYYEEAKQQMWLYFCRNLCEATTTNAPYDPTRSQVTTWLDNYLKRRLHDLKVENGRPKPSLNDPKIPEPSAPRQTPPMLEDVEDWVNTDSDGDLHGTHVKGHPQANCQILILRRLPPRTPWKEIARELDLPIATLSCFYQRKCLPRLRKFGEDRGYL